MPRDVSGNYTLPIGNPVVANTIIDVAWANPTMADLAQALTESLSRSGQGGMLGPFRLSAGSLINPALTFGSDLANGFYSGGTADLRASVGGIDLLRLTASLVTIAAPLTVGGAVTAVSYTGGGAGLTALNASNLASGTVPTARLGSGTPNSTNFLRGDGAWIPVTTGGGSAGTVTSIAMTGTSGIAVSPSGPILTAGTFALTLTDDLAALEGLFGTGFAVRLGTNSWGTQTAIDLSSQVTGNLGTNRLNGGSGANSGSFWRGDGVWSPISSLGGGTVTSVSLTGTSGISVTGAPITGSGGFTLGLSDDLAALEGLTTVGFAVRAGVSSWGTQATIGLASQVSGNLGTGNLNSGSGANSGTFWRGDGVWATPPSGNLVSSVAGRTGAVVLTAPDVGLGSVNNTSDAAKPVSTATQNALNGKVDNGTLSAYATLNNAALTGNTTFNGFVVGTREVIRRTTGIFPGQCIAPSGNNVNVNTGDCAAGFTFSVYNDSAGAITVVQGSGLTLRLAGTATTGNRTLAPFALATIWCYTNVEAIISGAGVS